MFQGAHGSAPEIMGQNKANPLAAILSGGLMLDYLADKSDNTALADAAQIIDAAVYSGFASNTIRPMEFGGDMSTTDVTAEVIRQIQAHK